MFNRFKYIALVICLCFNTSLIAKENNKDFSLIISGGISLGAYEAGYNWGLIKHLNHKKQTSQDEPIKLHSIAGASAGAINAMMSAMAWCRNQKEIDSSNLIDNNLFYNIWTAVDFEDLIIDKKFGTIDANNTTSLFSRKKLELLSENIFKELEEPYYEAGCSIPFGFAVTRVEPKISYIQDIKISNKLFHIPLYLKVDDDETARVTDNFKPKRDNTIHLSHDGNVSIERIKKAMFASSAFPIVFKQVELEYFHRKKFEKALFLDGGVFDNVPLDFAIQLSEDKAKNYIFMDPKYLRRELISKDFKEQLKINSPINSAIDLIGDIFSSSESSILYNTLAEKFKNSNEKKIRVSSRFFPITGMFLQHFGAFLDKGFREYDYFVGVYDSVVESSKYNCNKEDTECANRVKLDTYQLLSKGSNRAKYILNLLHKEEFGYPFERLSYPKEKDLHAIYKSIKHLHYQDMDEFHKFKNNLIANQYKAKNSYLKHTLSHPEEWYRQPFASLVHRIVNLENKNSDNLTPALSSLTAYGAGSYYKTKSGYTYNPVSAPLDYDKLWVKYFPYEFAFSKNIFSIGYENYYYFDKDSFFIPNAIELKPSTSIHYSDYKNKEDFIRVDLNLNYELSKDTVSIGFGPSLYHNLDIGSQGNDYFGGNVYVDFLNIFRITYAKRAKDDRYIYIGINDIPSLIYWLNN